MPEPLTTTEQIQDHLCARSAELHKAISALPRRYTNVHRLTLSNQLVGVRTILADIHGGQIDPVTPSGDPGAGVLIGWWIRRHPADWEGENAGHRYAEQLYYVMHRLLLHSRFDTVQQIATYLGASTPSSAYHVMTNPGGCQWSTLEPYVDALGGDHEEVLRLWEPSYRKRRGRRPMPDERAAGMSGLPTDVPDQDQGWEMGQTDTSREAPSGPPA